MVDLTIEGRKREAHLLVKVVGREDEVARRCQSSIRRGPAWAQSRRSASEVLAGGRAGQGEPGLGCGSVVPAPAPRAPVSLLPGPSASLRGWQRHPCIPPEAPCSPSPLASPNLGERGGTIQHSCGHAHFLGRRGLPDPLLFCLLLSWLIKGEKKSRLGVYFLQIFWTLSKVIFWWWTHRTHRRTVRDLILWVLQGTHWASLGIEHTAGWLCAEEWVTNFFFKFYYYYFKF